MDVSPGEIIHMDENGACKFPANKLEQVAEKLKLLRQEEHNRMSALSKATNAAEIRAIFEGDGQSYADKK
jgi:regulator of RNase E activity RraA